MCKLYIALMSFHLGSDMGFVSHEQHNSPFNMWNIGCILIIVWIICFVDGKMINECRLVLHALTTAVCQLYLALLPLRRATQHFAKSVRYFFSCILGYEWPELFYNIEEHKMLPCTCHRKCGIHWLESLCLFCEFLTHLLAVFSTLCVGVRHVLQGALFLLLSTARCLQLWLLALLYSGEVEEWQKKQKMQIHETQKEGEQVEGFLSEYCQDAITSLKPPKRKYPR